MCVAGVVEYRRIESITTGDGSFYLELVATMGRSIHGVNVFTE